jgi:hypothetical protein
MQTKHLGHFAQLDQPLIPLKTRIPRSFGTQVTHGRFHTLNRRSLEYPNPPKGKPRVQQGSSEKREGLSQYTEAARES